MYAMDTQSARKADSIGGQITELGKYVGKFTQAVDVTAGTGTKGIALAFQSDTGQKTRLSLYTMKADGEKIMGYEMLSAIMACLSLRNIAPKAGTYTQYNFDTRAEETKQGMVFPDLCNKPIGLLLETEDYLKKNGDTGTRMVLRGAFAASTELTATEILDRKTIPEQLPKMVQSLRHRPIRGNRQAAHAPASRQSGGGGGSGFDDMDDDIPFITASPLFDMVPSKSRRMARYDF